MFYIELICSFNFENWIEPLDDLKFLFSYEISLYYNPLLRFRVDKLFSKVSKNKIESPEVIYLLKLLEFK